MAEIQSKIPLSFSKKVKQTVRKGQIHVQPRQIGLKPHSISKSNLSKYSEKSQSKKKKYPTIHILRGQKSPYYFDVKNARSQRSNINNEQNRKISDRNDCWSIETSVQTKNASKGSEKLETKLIKKERSCRQFDKNEKKDRKFSENVNDVAEDYMNLKEEQNVQRKLMQMVLNEKQLRRLNKIYAVQETEYMIRILNAQKMAKQ